MIYFYFLTLFIYFFSIWKTKQNILSPFVFFGIFSFIYAFLPWYYLYAEPEIVNISLNYLDTKSAEKIILIQSFCNLLLCIAIYSPISRTIIDNIENKEPISNNKSWFWFFFPISLLLSWFFPWPIFGEAVTIGNSFAAFSKSFLLISFCFYCNKASSFKKSVAFSALLLVCLIDRSRTTLLLSVVLYLYFSKISYIKAVKYFPFLLVLFLLFVWVTLSRNGIDFESKYLPWIFYVEAIFGSYSSHQSIFIVDKGFSPVYSFVYPINDIIISIIPSFLFDGLDLIKNEYSLMANFVTNLWLSGDLSEKYSPMGGHFYLGEFYIYFKYLTPIFITLFYYLFLNIIKFIKYKELAILFYCSSFLLVKAPILNVFRHLLSLLAFYYLLTFILKKMKFKYEKN
jgi:hypothetical protein